MSDGTLATRLDALRARIAVAARRGGRHPDEVTLVAVSKGRAPDEVAAAHALGLRDFGENRVAELLEKRAACAIPGLRWHFIGHLQRRQARGLIGESALIHSVDRLSIAEALDRRAGAEGVTLRVLLQLNPSGEESKGGWTVGEPEGRDALHADVERILSLKSLRVDGLMAMAPFEPDPERTRPVFAALRATRDALAARYPGLELGILSMGMSNDFEVAIEEGATHIRVGTALFGPRTPT